MALNKFSGLWENDSTYLFYKTGLNNLTNIN